MRLGGAILFQLHCLHAALNKVGVIIAQGLELCTVISMVLFTLLGFLFGSWWQNCPTTKIALLQKFLEVHPLPISFAAFHMSNTHSLQAILASNNHSNGALPEWLVGCS